MTAHWAQDTSKLNKVELIKLRKDGLDSVNDIERYAKLGFSAIEEDDFDLLKWLGLYISRPKEAGFFLLRVKAPGGMLSSAQARVLASIAHDYGRDLLDISTRHAMQFHWIRMEYLPDIFARLESVGLSSVESAGDCPRTVVGNPVAGLDPQEILDARPILQEVSDFFHANREFSNLPRKFKISISASPLNTANAEIHDVSFTPAQKECNGKIVAGFHVMVGGGLSAVPCMAQDLNLFVRPDEVLTVARAAAVLFRDYGYREKRNHARLKFLLQDWGIEKFREELLKLTGPLDSRASDLTTGWAAGGLCGVHKQQQTGFSYVGLSVPLGRLNSRELQDLAGLADQYGDGTLRTTNSQNIVLTAIADDIIPSLLAEPVLQRLTPFPKTFVAQAICCTGTQFCPLGIVETKQRAATVLDYLDNHVQLDVPLVLHISGCVNSCGQNQIADIGLQGGLLRLDGQMVEAFSVSVGGRLGPQAAFGIKLKGYFPADQAAKVIESLVAVYQGNRKGQESFFGFVHRAGTENLQAALDPFVC